ncbi:MAG: hypothetical protein D6689_03300 [Deltaproteobacteria bacterium]|nr:MAG: hypothetical protein D6689_03300 [Deltaproteobacteria bacterium]
MKDQLRLLIELQRFDARIQELHQSMRALPEKLAPAKRDLEKLEAMLQNERDELERTETWRRDQEFILKQEEEAIKKAKAKLQASSSAKEFAAANRELEAKRKSMSEREEELLKVIDAIETSRKTLAEHEADVQKLRDTVAAEEAEIADKVAELQKQVDALQSDRDAVATKIDAAWRKRYEAVVQRRGIAIVPIADGACSGCHMRVPPQLANVLARAESLESCPSCHRLLYSPDLLPEQSDDGVSAAD